VRPLAVPASEKSLDMLRSALLDLLAMTLRSSMRYLCRLSMELNTRTPRPRLREAGLSSHRSLPVKCVEGILTCAYSLEPLPPI